MNRSERFDRFFENFFWPCDGGTSGSGHFGEWDTDDAGRPCYRYRHDGSSEDHWHMLGNDRIVATAHNRGYMQLWDWSRVLKTVNRYDPDHLNFGGGCKLIFTGERNVTTLRHLLPDPASMRLTFGMGYAEKEVRFDRILVRERYTAPRGDIPAILSETTISNESGITVNLEVIEYWGCNVFQIAPALIMTGRFGRFFTHWRDRFNKKHAMVSYWDEEMAVLQIDHNWNSWRPQWPKEWRAAWDEHYPTVFLAALDDLPEGFRAYATDATCLWTPEGKPIPTPTLAGQLAPRRSAFRGQAMLAIQRQLQIAPASSSTLRFVFGTADSESISDVLTEIRKNADTTGHSVVSIWTQDDTFLNRELVWHSYYLQAHAYYSDFFKTHFVDQGSAYSYVHGAISVPRDMSLYILALTWFRPDLAKECLRFQMHMQHGRSGKLPYCACGYGITTGFGIHSFSSDLDMFFLWGLAEYIGATGDYDFLDEVISYYPPRKGKKGTVLEHARAAFRHLTQHVGVGRHGLLRSMSGDWNDVLLAFAPNAIRSLLRGESTLNAGLASVALPAFAAITERRDIAFASELRAFAQQQSEALKSCFTGKWVHRGFLGKRDVALGEDRIFLDTQGFGVLGGVWNEEQTASIFKHIDELCVAPEPAGARCMYPPMEGNLLEPGMDTNGGTWAAVDAWTVAAWARHDPKSAWDYFLRTTMAAHADAYPDTWYGIWSGPDSYNAAYHKDAGKTFNINLTPMTDFPVMNMNRHAGVLIAARHLAGIGATDGLIKLAPRVPHADFAFRTPLIGGIWFQGKHRGYYTPVCDGRFRFAVAAPESVSKIVVNGHTRPLERDREGLVRITEDGTVGNRIQWEIE